MARKVFICMCMSGQFICYGIGNVVFYEKKIKGRTLVCIECMLFVTELEVILIVTCNYWVRVHTWLDVLYFMQEIERVWVEGTIKIQYKRYSKYSSFYYFFLFFCMFLLLVLESLHICTKSDLMY